MKILVVLIAATLAACQAPALPALPDARPGAPPEVHPVRAQLLADVAGVEAGRMFTVGVLLRMEPGWHVYWKNPGESGLPTGVKLSLPEGFTAGEIQWPAPTRFVQPGDIVGYGYDDSVLLLVPVTAPARLTAGAPVAIGAEAKWLVCEKVCISGNARLDLSLPVGESSGAANAPLFAEWRGRLPVKADSADSPVASKVATARGAKTAYTIDLDWKAPVSDVQWFPAADQALDVTDISVETAGGRTRITFTAEVFPGQNRASSILETVVGYRDAGGARRGVLVPVELAVGKRGASIGLEQGQG